MIDVNTVYQKVLALANKEQRGYITPQDFNLFANQAQMEIFEQYFYDVNIARKSQGNDTVYADVDDMLEEKLQIFESEDSGNTVFNYNSVPSADQSDFIDSKARVLPRHIYRIHKVLFEKAVCEIVNTKDFYNTILSGPLTQPSDSRPIVNIQNNIIRTMGGGRKGFIPGHIIYFRIPKKVNWTYVVVNKQALFNNIATTSHFELHPSEENQLVNKILKLAGISNKQPDIMQAGQGMDMATTQQQPKI
jgi:hypothetical protein